MEKIVFLYKDEFPSYGEYRKAIFKYRHSGYVIRNIKGGVACFMFLHIYEEWKNERKLYK